MIIKELSVIFPIYNEEDRLIKNLNKISNLFASFRSYKFEIILVNDGSIDRSDEIIKKYIKSLSKNNKRKIIYIYYKKNMGKGCAIKKGIEKSSMKWILTCDIDFSANPKEIKRWVKLNFIRNLKSCYFASRSLPESQVTYKHHRYYLGNIFNYLVSIMFNLNINDTQCGFKLYHKNYAKRIFSKLNEYRYSHDVEIAVLLKKDLIKIYELPIKWVHRDKSKLNIFTDGLNMIFKLIFIRIRY